MISYINDNKPWRWVLIKVISNFEIDTLDKMKLTYVQIYGFVVTHFRKFTYISGNEYLDAQVSCPTEYVGKDYNWNICAGNYSYETCLRENQFKQRKWSKAWFFDFWVLLYFLDIVFFHILGWQAMNFDWKWILCT